MKILRSLIFLSILSGIFFVIYRQSDEKGFRRWWISFKIAVLIAASAAGLITNPVEAIEPDTTDNSTRIERVISNQELGSLDDSNSRVVLVKTPGQGGHRAPYFNSFRPADKPINQQLGGAANPAGPGGGGGEGSTVEFDDQCPAPQKQQSKTSNSKDISNLEQLKDQKKKVKKRRNSHLDRKVEINGKKFNLERAQVEKKTPIHGFELGLDPEIGQDGKPIINKKTNKPMVKGNKENYNLFTDNLEKFMEKTEMRDGYFRKGRENEQKSFNFYDAKTHRVAAFNKETGNFISIWALDKPGELEEFLNNHNVI